MQKTYSKELKDSLKKISQTYREPSQSLIYSKEIKYEIRSLERSDCREHSTRKRSKSCRELDDGWLEIDSFDELLRKIEAELADFDTKKNVQTSTGYNNNYGYSNFYSNYNSYQQPYNYYQTYQTAYNYGYNYPYNYYPYQANTNYNQQYNYFPNPPQSANLGYSETSKHQHKSRKPSNSRERPRRSRKVKEASSLNSTHPTNQAPTPLANNKKSSRSTTDQEVAKPKESSKEQCVSYPPYESQIEKSIRSSTKPIPSKGINVIDINGVRGIWLNKEECDNWKGDLPLSNYEINTDPEPEVIKLKHSECLEQIKQVSIKYLKPPKLEQPGPLIIKQEPNILPPEAPPIIIREISDPVQQPEPLIIREKPPNPPEQISSKTIIIPGKRLPPPPRRVIIEKMAPAPPELPAVTVERWLPYEKRERKVVFQECNQEICIEKPRNLIFEWEPQCVNNKTVVTDLGVEDVDPFYYSVMHQDTLKSKEELPQFALDAKQIEETKYDIQLVGDIEALKLIDLEREGLSEYKRYVK